jgi:serine/threonine protein kinase
MEAGGDTLRTELDNRNSRKLVSAEDVVITTLKNGVQILNGLEAIHKMNREHRAIKPENVVRGHHGQLQLMDLGVCLMETSVRDLDFGPSMYGYNRKYGEPPKCFFDVFSAGVIFYEVSNVGEAQADDVLVRSLTPLASSQSVATGPIKARTR